MEKSLHTLRSVQSETSFKCEVNAAGHKSLDKLEAKHSCPSAELVEDSQRAQTERADTGDVNRFQPSSATLL